MIYLIGDFHLIVKRILKLFQNKKSEFDLPEFQIIQFSTVYIYYTPGIIILLYSMLPRVYYFRIYYYPLHSILLLY